MSTFETKMKKMFLIDLNNDLKEEPEEQPLVYSISTGNARLLNMPESAEICPNVGKYP